MIKIKCTLSKKNAIAFDKIIFSRFEVVSERYNTVPVMLINIPIRIIKHSFLKKKKGNGWQKYQKLKNIGEIHLYTSEGR